MNQSDVREALRQIVLGSGVNRGSHLLALDTGEDATSLFESVLSEEGFHPARVDEVSLKPGERVPAFYLEGEIAYFGWVFWEAFFPGRMRKIFGSVERNEKGDWFIILGKGSKQPIHVNKALKEGMDLEHPSAF